MLTPLNTHILELKNLVQELRSSLTSPKLTDAERVRVERKIALGSEALDHYRRAFESECALRNDRDPPGAVPSDQRRANR